MSKNINQIFIANPATSLQSTDLFYLGRSPYGSTDDFAAQFSTILAAVNGGMWNNITTTSATMVAGQSYVANSASLVTLTLPTTAAFGTVIEVCGSGAGGFAIAQNSLQQINFGSLSTTAGMGGSISSTDRFDAIRLLCVSANLTWNVLSSVGNLTVV